MQSHTMLWVGRLALALVFVGIAAYCAWVFASMPYELVQTCTTSAKPDGTGLFFVGFFAGLSALAALLVPSEG